MKKLIVVCLILTVSILVSSCGPRKPGEESRTPVKVYDLRVDVGHERMTVVWKKQGDALISGYNIYINRQPAHEGSEPFNATPFPGDTDPTDGIEHFEAETLDNGVKYYVSVRAVYPDGSLSAPTDEKVVVCGGRGVLTLDIRYRSGDDGFSFTEDTVTRADADNNDIYYYAKDGQDFLASPVRLNGFLRNTRLMLLTARASRNKMIASVSGSSKEPSEDRVQVEEGSWVLAKTVDGYALLHVESFEGSGEDRRITVEYMYSPLTSEIFF